MLGLRTADRHTLVALCFRGESEFRAAARRAATTKTPVEVPGNFTLIIPASAIPLFDGLKYDRVPVADPGKINDAERSVLRRRIR
jgi:hypothetical protein